MSRLDRLREMTDEILRQQPDRVESSCGFWHLYGVATTCAILALKRGLDPELCTTAGVLHDIWAYKTGNPANHAELGAPEAEKMLRELGEYSEEEILAVKTAIMHHSNKEEIHDDMSELLKDADVLQHNFYSGSRPVHAKHANRLKSLREELGIV